MPKQNITITDLLSELQKTISIRGVEGTLALLKNGREEVSDDADMQFTVIMVCTHFQITIEQMVNEKNDLTKYAKGFIVHYLRIDFERNWADIKQLLGNKDQAWLWRLSKLIKELKPTLRAHTQWVGAKKEFDKQIKNYKSKK